MAQECGLEILDNHEFNAKEMCCACGGGRSGKIQCQYGCWIVDFNRRLYHCRT